MFHPAPSLPTPSSTLPVRVEPMQVADIPDVMEIERQVFPLSWSSGIYHHEITTNPWSYYLVIRPTHEGHPPILAYGGIWQFDASAHIATIATHPAYPGRGLASYLLLRLLKLGQQLGCTEATLEVRISNRRAQALYRRYGFEIVGQRRGYYSDNHEDALVMTRNSLDPDQLTVELDAVEERLRLSFHRSPV